MPFWTKAYKIFTHARNWIHQSFFITNWSISGMSINLLQHLLACRSSTPPIYLVSESGFTTYLQKVGKQPLLSLLLACFFMQAPLFCLITYGTLLDFLLLFQWIVLCFILEHSTSWKLLFGFGKRIRIYPKYHKPYWSQSISLMNKFRLYL